MYFKIVTAILLLQLGLLLLNIKLIFEKATSL